MNVAWFKDQIWSDQAILHSQEHGILRTARFQKLQGCFRSVEAQGVVWNLSNLFKFRYRKHAISILTSSN